MKKILVLLAVPALMLGLATPAYADGDNKIISRGDSCGPDGNKVIQTVNIQRRFDMGTPGTPGDDEISFDVDNFTELTIDFEQGRNDVDDFKVKILRTVFGSQDQVWHRDVNYASGAPFREEIEITQTNNLSVSTEPFVKVIVNYNGGAQCVTKMAWNDNW